MGGLPSRRSRTHDVTCLVDGVSSDTKCQSRDKRCQSIGPLGTTVHVPVHGTACTLGRWEPTGVSCSSRMAHAYAMSALPDLPPDDGGPQPRWQSRGGRPLGIGNRQARRPVAVAAAGLETALAKRRRVVVTVVTAPDDDAGDLPEDVFAELALDGPVQGPAGRVASIRDPKHSRLKVVYQGRSIQGIMQVLEMVPCRQAMLWEAPTMRPLDGTVPDDLMEIYSPNRMVAEAQKLGLKAELSIDLLTGWNLLDMEVQVRVVQEIKARRPKVLMMSPPCTWFSGFMNMNWSRITPVVREQALRDATLHLEFCMLLADLQESSGRGWALEHPDSAKSWQNQKVMSIMQ